MAIIKGTSKRNILDGTAGNDTIYGYGGDDDLYGRNGNNTLIGGNGNDRLFGGTGHDKLFGEAGNDQLYGGTGNDKLDGGAGNDKLRSGAGNDTLTGGLGDDDLNGAAGSDKLLGGAGFDFLGGGIGNDVVEGGAGADNLAGGDGIDTLSYASDTTGINITLDSGAGLLGDAAGDIFSGFENLLGGFGSDQLSDSNLQNAIANVINGGAGDDNIFSLGGGDTLIGGSGSDLVNIVFAAGATVSLAISGPQDTGNGVVTLISFENISGDAGGDTLTGDAGANSIDGQGGDDVIEGGAGADNLDGSGGTDTLSYEHSALGVTVTLAGAFQTSAGDANGDVAFNFENIRGSASNDVLTGNSMDNLIEGGSGGDTLDGGDGIDTLSYAHDTAGVAVSFAIINSPASFSSGDAEGDSAINFENILGGSAGDSLRGDAGYNRIDGGGGSDFIYASGGVDILTGGDNDLDYVLFYYAPAAVTVSLAQVAAQNLSSFGSVTLSGFEGLWGSFHNDTLTGSASGEDIRGSLGNDVIEGGAGDDLLIGDEFNNGLSGIDTASYASSSAGVTVNLVTGAGLGGDAQGDFLFGFENLIGSSSADTLTGDDGANSLTGGGGADTLTGGAGSDVFFYSSFTHIGDHITDFVSGSDMIGLDLPVGDPVNFAAGSNPTPGSGASWFLYDTDDGKLYYTVDGSGQDSVLFLTLDGAPSLLGTDFLVV